MMIKKLLLPVILLVSGLYATAQTSKDATVALSAAVSTAPPGITLNWPVVNTADIQIKRRIKGQLGSQWVQLLNLTNSTQTTLTDLDITIGTTFEYHIKTVVNGVTGHGYAHVAVLAPLVDYRGKILVFIDSTTADAVGNELKIFKDAMRGDGWQPIPTKTGPSTTVQSIKNQIISYYNADPTNVKAVLLIGDVPVPYSGNFAWDGHSDHAGAWPSDAYYADLNGNWTDVSVNTLTPGRTANDNIPGDGKFDQTFLPSPAELMVGRIDFRHLSAATFGATPIELTKRYLLKSARWRTKQYTVPYRALVDDNFGYFSSEAFAANGYRNAYPIVGAANVTNGDFLNDTGGEGYLFGYGCGSGWYTSAGGVGTSAQMANDSINVVFSNVFGSYHGDWDYESDPLMPAVLASKGSVLNCSWAGRPHWFMQALASGETIGYCTKETMNAQTNTEYPSNTGRGGAHVALLGDPTTRAIIVAQVPELSFVTHCNTIDLNWSASPDTGILGYHVYRALGLDGPYTRITTDLVNALTWTDNNPLNDTLFYQVRAVRIDQTPGGGIFYNASSGIIRFIVFQQGPTPVITTTGNTILTCNNPTAVLTAVSNIPLSQSVTWTGPNGYVASGNQVELSLPGIYIANGVTAEGCTGFTTITITEAPPLPSITFPVFHLTCISPEAHLTLPNLPVVYTFNGQEYQAGDNITLVDTGHFDLTLTSISTGCNSSSDIVVTSDIVPPNVQTGPNPAVLNCTTPSIVLTATSDTPDVVFQWTGSGNTVTTSGEYCVIATNLQNGCTSSACITVEVMTDVPVIQSAVTNVSGPGASNGSINLTVILLPGSTNATFQWSNGATTQNISALTAGTYTVTVTTENGCHAIQTIDVGITSGIDDITEGITITISPNPASDFAKITVHTAQASEAILKMTDVNGRLISTQSGGISADHTFIVETSNLPDGFYPLYLSSGEKRLIRKLVVCNSEK